METINIIVQAGGDVNAANNQFGTPLCLAAIRRDLAAVTFLIEHNASVNKICNMLGSAAHAACAGGDLAVMRALHTAGADWKTPARVRVSTLCHLSRLVQSDRALVASCIPNEERQIQSAGAIAVRFRHCEAVEFCLGLPKGLSVDEPWQFISKSSAASMSSDLLALFTADILAMLTLRQLGFKLSSIYVFGQFPRTAALGDSMSLLSLAMSTLDIRTAEVLLDHGARDSLLVPLGRGADTSS
jgi:ankyrin repeat protein